MDASPSQPAEFDLGPLAGLASGLEEGSLPLDAAKKAARQYGAEGSVSPEQSVGMVAAALQVASAGEWRRALPIAEVAYEAASSACQAHPGDPALAEAWVMVGADLLEVIHHGVVEQGDVRLYLRATEVGEEVIAAAEALGFPRIQGLVAFRLGALLVDAYTGNRSPTNYEGQVGTWMAKARLGDDPELARLTARQLAPDGEPGPGAGDQPAEWPEPLDALSTAERLLRSAVPLVVPRRQGEVLKALSQALEWRGLLGGAADQAELRSVTEQALEALEPDDQRRLALIATLERAGGSAASATALLERLEEGWSEYVADTDPHLVWDAVSQGAALIGSSEPERALALLTRHRELETMWSDETLRARHFERELSLFAHAYGGPVWDAAWEDPERGAEIAQTLVTAATTPAESREAAAGLIAVMLAAAKGDREAFALSQTETLLAIDRSLWEEHEDAVVYLLANLLLGEGVNRMGAGDFDAAGRYYRQAADAFVPTGMAAATVQCIDYLDDVVTSGTSELDEIAAWLATSSLQLELVAPAGAPASLQRLASHVLAAELSAGTSALVVQILFEVLNGRRFAAMLSGGTGDFTLDHYTLHMLSREAEAEAELPAESDLRRPVSFDTGLGDDDMVTAWVNEYEKGPSETAADRVTNVQRAIERHLSSVLVPSQTPMVAMLDEIRGCLDERTALLQLVEGPWTDGRLAIFQLLIAQGFEEAQAGLAEMPSGTVQASWRGRSVTMPESGFYVGSLRRGFQADPGPLELATEAAEQLPGATKHYLRVIDVCRDQLDAAGIERLLIAPHGSSRFLPLHLLGPPGEPLADRFAISYLANVNQLTLARPPRPRREGVDVFGLSYADQPELPRLDDSATEARTIADTCGTMPILDDEATESAFKRSLESRRYVHLRAHGQLNFDAPSFHTVFLHPEDGSDGRLRAYEVLPLDLSGLELVTLGACETALGRVDRSDNPRGLPAALLLAGAQSVIGTLWPVLAAASTCFFASLYETLMGSQEGDVLTAFATAQRATRARHPEYRDWGAFYLIGAPPRKAS